MYTTINSTYTLPMPTANLSTKIQSRGVTNVDKFTYSSTTANRYEQAIIDTVKFLGFMSLKNGDHNVSGHNTVTTKRILKEAIETRKAADVLLASGAVVLLGTWSNGIAVGPGEGFVPISHTTVTPITAAKKSRKAHTNPRGTAAETIAYNAERLAAAEEKITGDYCEWTPAPVVAPVKHYSAPITDHNGKYFYCAEGEAWELLPTTGLDWENNEALHGAYCAPRYNESVAGLSCDWQPAVILGPAYVAPLGTPPGLSCDGFGNHYDWASLWHAHCDMIARTTERPTQPTTDAPTPIRAMPAYTAVVGDTVSLTYAHENGTTTDRVVTIHRMTASGFRGYDHTYRKARNYHFDHITRLVLHTGEEDIAAG